MLLQQEHINKRGWVPALSRAPKWPKDMVGLEPASMYELIDDNVTGVFCVGASAAELAAVKVCSGRQGKYNFVV